MMPISPRIDGLWEIRRPIAEECMSGNKDYHPDFSGSCPSALTPFSPSLPLFGSSCGKSCVQLFPGERLANKYLSMSISTSTTQAFPRNPASLSSQPYLPTTSSIKSPCLELLGVILTPNSFGYATIPPINSCLGSTTLPSPSTCF
jgi:hypothetical protein